MGKSKRRWNILASWISIVLWSINQSSVVLEGKVSYGKNFHLLKVLLKIFNIFNTWFNVTNISFGIVLSLSQKIVQIWTKELLWWLWSKSGRSLSKNFFFSSFSSHQDLDRRRTRRPAAPPHSARAVHLDPPPRDSVDSGNPRRSRPPAVCSASRRRHPPPPLRLAHSAPALRIFSPRNPLLPRPPLHSGASARRPHSPPDSGRALRPGSAGFRLSPRLSPLPLIPVDFLVPISRRSALLPPRRLHSVALARALASVDSGPLPRRSPALGFSVNRVSYSILFKRGKEASIIRIYIRFSISSSDWSRKCADSSMDYWLLTYFFGRLIDWSIDRLFVAALGWLIDWL